MANDLTSLVAKLEMQLTQAESQCKMYVDTIKGYHNDRMAIAQSLRTHGLNLMPDGSVMEYNHDQ